MISILVTGKVPLANPDLDLEDNQWKFLRLNWASRGDGVGLSSSSSETRFRNRIFLFPPKKSLFCLFAIVKYAHLSLNGDVLKKKHKLSWTKSLYSHHI